ncbi:MAG: glutamine amidotransferase [Deltaproteobacteria bacterium]|nr:glutamine amidotransferase [Deltaproteobacteria bacterium]
MDHIIVKVGRAAPEVAKRRGDYDAWFAALTGWGDAAKVVSPPDGDALPSPSTCAAVLVTGSSAMVTDAAEWSERTGAWLAELVRAEVPTLGVCYGHQLMAKALGGRVGNNPRGRAIGTREVRMMPAAHGDPVFHGAPEVLTVQLTHREVVLEPPAGAERLIRAEHDPHHGLRFGPRAWGVQFHPEMDTDYVRLLIRQRAAAIREEGMDPEALEAGLRDSDDGAALLARFGAFTR